MTKPIDFIISKIEKERKIKIPICLLNDEGLDKLNKLIKNRSAIGISLYYKNFKNYINLEPFYLIDRKLNKNRSVSDVDKKLIKKLILVKNKDPDFFFDFVGNLYYIASLIDDMNNNSLSKTIKISLVLFIFVNMAELVNRYISELLREYLRKSKFNKIKKDVKEYLNYFKNGEHPMIGITIKMLCKNKFLEHSKESLFYENKLIRNKISHANIFYDNHNDCLYLTNGNEYKLEKLRNEFNQLYQFLIEFIYQYNINFGNIINKIDSMFKELSRRFLLIERSPNIKKIFKSMVFEWD